MAGMNRFGQAMTDDWKAVPTEVGMIADHFRLPWRFYARMFAVRGPGRA
jgi:hypothetical protein